MDAGLLSAVQITIAGMSLVFLAILVLWLVMAALVRFTGASKLDETGSAAIAEDMRRAAAAAVALALAEKENRPEIHEFPIPPTAIVSAWQAVMRGKMLNKRGSVK